MICLESTVRRQAWRTAVALVVVLLGAARAEAQISGPPGLLRINSAVAGSAPTSKTDGTTTFTVSAGSTPKRIRAKLNTPMPAGVTLKVTLAAPPGATSLGPVTLTTTAQNLVTGVKNVSNVRRKITYTLSATSAAGVVSLKNKIVTFTLTP